MVLIRLCPAERTAVTHKFYTKDDSAESLFQSFFYGRPL